jgi:hypothetical protein
VRVFHRALVVDAAFERALRHLQPLHVAIAESAVGEGAAGDAETDRRDGDEIEVEPGVAVSIAFVGQTCLRATRAIRAFAPLAVVFDDLACAH